MAQFKIITWLICKTVLKCGSNSYLRHGILSFVTPSLDTVLVLPERLLEEGSWDERSGNGGLVSGSGVIMSSTSYWSRTSNDLKRTNLN